MDNEKNVGNVPSGDDVNKTGEASGDQETGEVSYSTYKKTLSQLKNLQEKYKEQGLTLNSFVEKEQQLEQKRLEEQGEYKKLLDLERQKLSQYEQERDSYKNKLITAHKLNAFNEKLPSKIANPKYYSHVPVDDILIDPETGLVDDSSVDSVVSSFIKEHPTLLETKSNPMPSDAPGTKSTLTHAEWLKLPSLKEKKARMHEVYNNDS